MSGRAVRKALRQREAELLQAQTPEEFEESDDEPAIAPPKPSLFALLNIADERDEQDDEDDEEEPEPVPEPVKPVASAKKSKKKKKAKAKAKAKGEGKAKEEVEEDDGEDDIDRALRQLNIASPGTSTPAAGTAEEIQMEVPLSAVLKVDSRNLDAGNEMKKLFGRDALRPDAGEGAAPGGRRRGRMQMMPGVAGGRALAKSRKNTFVQPKEEWPNAGSGGLGMEIEDSDPTTGVTTFKFVHSRQYQGVQREFTMCVASMGKSSSPNCPPGTTADVHRPPAPPDSPPTQPLPHNHTSPMFRNLPSPARFYYSWRSPRACPILPRSITTLFVPAKARRRNRPPFIPPSRESRALLVLLALHQEPITAWDMANGGRVRPATAGHGSRG
jgi:hypothetical protein